MANSIYDVIYYDGGYYGAEYQPGVLNWALEIDWDNDGLYSGDNEAGYMMSLNIKRGREFYIKSDGSGFETVRPGVFTATLRNVDGRFDPFNTGSDLYPYITPGKRFRLRVRHGTTIYNIIDGRISGLRPVNDGGVEKIIISGVDGLDALQKITSFGGITPNTTIGAEITNILSGVGLSSAVDTITQKLDYFWWNDNNLLDILNELCAGCLATFFMANDGTATVYDRKRVDASTETITGTDILNDIMVPMPWETIRNYITMDAQKYALGAYQVIYNHPSTPFVQPGDTLILNITPDMVAYGGAITGVVASRDPNAYDGGVYTWGGSFVNNGANYAFSITNPNSFGLYFLGIQLSGYPILASQVQVIAENTGSQSTFGKSTLTLGGRFCQDENIARDIAAGLLTVLALVNKFPTIKLANNPALQFSTDLFDVISLNIASKNIIGDYRLGYIEHSWMSSIGSPVETTFSLEPILQPTGEYWKFTGSLGVDKLGW
jgi:hypothetical protein